LALGADFVSTPPTSTGLKNTTKTPNHRNRAVPFSKKMTKRKKRADGSLQLFDLAQAQQGGNEREKHSSIIPFALRSKARAVERNEREILSCKIFNSSSIKVSTQLSILRKSAGLRKKKPQCWHQKKYAHAINQQEGIKRSQKTQVEIQK
jgi:hypothetical protein